MSEYEGIWTGGVRSMRTEEESDSVDKIIYSERMFL